MSAATHGAGSGAVFGIALVFLFQQLGYVSLSSPATALELLAVTAVAAAVFFGIVGWVLGRISVRARLKKAGPAS